MLRHRYARLPYHVVRIAADGTETVVARHARRHEAERTMKHCHLSDAEDAALAPLEGRAVELVTYRIEG